MAVSFLGWRSIFWISIAVAVLALYLIRDTPDLEAADSRRREHRFDWPGLLTFVAAMLAINVFISQGPKLGWFSGASLGLVVAFVVFILAFFRIETTPAGTVRRSEHVRQQDVLRRHACRTSCSTAAAGTLVVALGLVQRAAGWSSLQSGLLTLGYLVAILATIRVGEKLLQRFGPKKPMLWGARSPPSASC